MSIIVVCALMVAVGVVTVPAPAWRRRAGLALGWLAAATPLLVWRFGTPEAPFVRFLAGLGAAAALARGWELGREARPRPWRARVFHTTTLFDSRTAARAPREVRWRDGLAATLYYGLAAAGFALAFLVAPASPPGLDHALRWLGGVVLVYGAMDGIAAGLRFCYALAGWRTPALQVVPIASRSLGEFWGERWNRPVSTWLRRACLIPLARRGRARLGLLWAFTVSALLHAYLTAIAIGWRLALAAGSLFVLHGLLISVENVLAVRRWPPVAGRVWFAVAMLGTTPLIVEPLLRIVQPGA